MEGKTTEGPGATMRTKTRVTDWRRREGKGHVPGCMEGQWARRISGA